MIASRMAFVLSVILGNSCLSRAFLSSTNVLRFLFKKMTPGSNWPEVQGIQKFKTMEECAHFDPGLDFPEYYLKDFHSYKGGNLNPVAAKEAMSATSAVMTHHFNHLSGDESSHYIRSAFSVMTRSRNIDLMTGDDDKTIVDFGCGIGVSTSYMRDAFREDTVIGIDLSPYFLDETGGVNADFVHGNIEDTHIETNSVDVVSISYVLHELPYDVSIRILKEAHRILKPGTGVLSILDMHNPKSSSPIMRYIFDRTEPYLSEYSRLTRTMSDDLYSIGFEDVRISEGFPKTIVFLATKESLEKHQSSL